VYVFKQSFIVYLCVHKGNRSISSILFLPLLVLDFLHNNFYNDLCGCFLLTYFSQYVLCFELHHHDRSASNTACDKTMLYLFFYCTSSPSPLSSFFLVHTRDWWINWHYFAMMYTSNLIYTFMIVDFSFVLRAYLWHIISNFAVE